MPSTILDNVKGSDLPKTWAEKINILPNKIYTVIIQPQEERQSLQKIMSQVSKNAKARGMTPDILENILGEKIKHLL
jgi:hypothetical protein